MLLFHEFYVQIESIFEQTNKNGIVSSIVNVKEENDDEMVGGGLGSETTLKCEPVFSDDSSEGRKIWPHFQS